MPSLLKVLLRDSILSYGGALAFLLVNLVICAGSKVSFCLAFIQKLADTFDSSENLVWGIHDVRRRLISVQAVLTVRQDRPFFILDHWLPHDSTLLTIPPVFDTVLTTTQLNIRETAKRRRWEQEDDLRTVLVAELCRDLKEEEVDVDSRDVVEPHADSASDRPGPASLSARTQRPHFHAIAGGQC